VVLATILLGWHQALFSDQDSKLLAEWIHDLDTSLLSIPEIALVMKPVAAMSGRQLALHRNFTSRKCEQHYSAPSTFPWNVSVPSVCEDMVMDFCSAHHASPRECFFDLVHSLPVWHHHIPRIFLRHTNMSDWAALFEASTNERPFLQPLLHGLVIELGPQLKLRQWSNVDIKLYAWQLCERTTRPLTKNAVGILNGEVSGCAHAIGHMAAMELRDGYADAKEAADMCNHHIVAQPLLSAAMHYHCAFGFSMVQEWHLNMLRNMTMDVSRIKNDEHFSYETSAESGLPKARRNAYMKCAAYDWLAFPCVLLEMVIGWDVLAAHSGNDATGLVGDCWRTLDMHRSPSLCVYSAGMQGFTASIMVHSKSGRWTSLETSANATYLCGNSQACVLLRRTCEVYVGWSQKFLLNCIAGAMDMLWVQVHLRPELLFQSMTPAGPEFPTDVQSAKARARSICRLVDWGCNAQRLCLLSTINFGVGAVVNNVYEADLLPPLPQGQMGVCISELMV